MFRISEQAKKPYWPNRKQDSYGHDEVINFDKAKKLGSNVCPHTEFPAEWTLFRELLAKYMLQSVDKHVIRFVIPEKLLRPNKTGN